MITTLITLDDLAIAANISPDKLRSVRAQALAVFVAATAKHRADAPKLGWRLNQSRELCGVGWRIRRSHQVQVIDCALSGEFDVLFDGNLAARGTEQSCLAVVKAHLQSAPWNIETASGGDT